MHKTRIRLYLSFNYPIRKNKIRFMYKTRIFLYLCFNKPIRKKQIRFIHKTRIRLYPCLNRPIRENQICFMHWFNLLINLCLEKWVWAWSIWNRLKLLNDKRRKAQKHHANFTALVALICTGRIAERTASCDMLLTNGVNPEIGLPSTLAWNKVRFETSCP
jgi:hypothetical protein